jgi:HSP20 family protein
MAMERWRPIDRFDPFRNVGEIQQEVNRIFDSFFGRPSAQGARGDRVWAPLVDMYETKDDLVLMAEVPGVKEKDVSVSITGDLISIKGERRFDEEMKEPSVLHLERVYGRFERLVQLPMPVQADKVKATYRDGVLEIRLPKAEEVKPRQIKIDIL